MPEPVLVDTGPLVACFSPADHEHFSCMEKLRLLKGRRLVTTLAIVTETLYLLDFSPTNQQKFLQFAGTGVLEVLEIVKDDFYTIANLMEKYRDCPMDFADATLVVLAGRLKTRQVFTLDEHDFTVYRTLRGQGFEKT